MVQLTSTVVDIQCERNDAAEGNVLSRCAHSCVGEEEDHGEESTDSHGVLPTQRLEVAHETSSDRTEDASDTAQHVVSPLVVRARLSGLGSTSSEILGEEDVEEGIGQTWTHSGLELVHLKNKLVDDVITD